MHEIAGRIVERFRLEPHPEGGFFREVYRSNVSFEHPGIDGGLNTKRCGGTLIYFLLAERQFSAFHRLRWTDEIWHLYAGGALELHTLDERDGHATHVLTSDLERGEPAAVVPAGRWQAARLAAGSSWAFCGCTVSPGFELADFEMPQADELIKEHPAHERIIRELTRG
jgi:hypothetical protein